MFYKNILQKLFAHQTPQIAFVINSNSMIDLFIRKRKKKELKFSKGEIISRTSCAPLYPFFKFYTQLTKKAFLP